MRRSLAILLTGGLLLLGPLALASGASAATIAATTTCSNGVDNTGGLGLICEVTIVNTITEGGGPQRLSGCNACVSGCNACVSGCHGRAECNACAECHASAESSAYEHYGPDHRAAERHQPPGPRRTVVPRRAVADRGVQAAWRSTGYALTQSASVSPQLGLPSRSSSRRGERQ
jgi:hypothetical protein